MYVFERNSNRVTLLYVADKFHLVIKYTFQLCLSERGVLDVSPDC